MSTPEESLETAKVALEKIGAALVTLVDLHENSRLLLFSSTIADQLGESYATRAFERCRLAIFEAELVRLCALWDLPDSRSVLPPEFSLPAVSKLAMQPDVQLLIKKEFIPHETKLGMTLWRGPSSIRKIAGRVDRISKSELLKCVINYRNKFLAHNLKETRLELGQAQTLDPPRYRNVSELLSATITLTRDLTVDVSGASFQWNLQRTHSRRCAEALWLGSKFNPIE